MVLNGLTFLSQLDWGPSYIISIAKTAFYELSFSEVAVYLYKLLFVIVGSAAKTDM